MLTRFRSSGRSVLLVGALGGLLLTGIPAAGAAGPPTQAPTNVRATAAPESAGVQWTGIAEEATGYLVTAAPGGQQCSTSSASATACYVQGLTAGQAYTFTVQASNDDGLGPASVPSDPVIIDPITPDADITMKRLPATVTRSNVKFRTEVTATPEGRIRLKVESRPRMNASGDWLVCRKGKDIDSTGTYRLSCDMGKKARAALREAAIKVRVTAYIRPPADEGMFDTKAWTIKRVR